MKLQLVKETTSQTALIFIQDSSSTTGAGLAGLAFGSSGLSWYYYREAAGTGATQVTLATMTIGTWATGGFIELDAADMPGWYEIGIPDAALATGAGFVGMQFKGATNMAQLNLEIQLTSINLNDAVRAGLTALPNAAADAAGGLIISDAGGLDADAMNTAAVRLTAARAQVLTDWINNGRLDLILDIIAADTTTDIPALITARTLLAAAYFDFTTDSTNVGSISNDAITALSIAASALDGKGDWNIGKTGYSLTITPPTAVQNREEMDSNSVDLNTLITQIGTAGAGLTDLGGMSTSMKAEVLAEIVKLLVTQMTESYAADGVAPNMTQALMLIQQVLTEFAFTGTLNTIKKLDGSTSAAVMTLDDGTNPTSSTRTL